MCVSVNEKWRKNLLPFIYTDSKYGDLYFAQEVFPRNVCVMPKGTNVHLFFSSLIFIFLQLVLNSLQAPFMFRNPGHFNHSPYFGDACATDRIFYSSWRLPIRGCFWNYQAAASCKSFGNIKGERCEGQRGIGKVMKFLSFFGDR